MQAHYIIFFSLLFLFIVLLYIIHLIFLEDRKIVDIENRNRILNSKILDLEIKIQKLKK